MDKWQRLQDAVGGVIVGAIFYSLVPNLIAPEFSTHPIGIGVAVLLVVVVWLVLKMINAKKVRELRSKLAVHQSPGVPPRRGLIVLGSPGTRVTAAENAIKVHFKTLEHCWIIAGPDSGQTKPTARENAYSTKEHYEKLKPDGELRFHIEDVDDEHNPEKVFHLVQSIYHRARAAGLQENEVIADYTGGTKSMTAGMILAASTAPDRNAEYMKATNLTDFGTAEASSEARPMLVQVRF